LALGGRALNAADRDARLTLMVDEQDSARDEPGATSSLTPSPTRRPPIRLSTIVTFVGIAAVVVLLDQVTKRLVDHTLLLYQSWPSESWPVHLTHASNTGAAFSILQDQTPFLIVTSLIGLAAILLFFFYPPFEHPLLRVALGLQLGGAIGNLIDRVAYGSVTDFIQFPHYPAFNVADSSIVIGVAILVWFLVFRDDRGRQQSQ
jgi:signal peptidase II